MVYGEPVRKIDKKKAEPVKILPFKH